MTSATPNKPFSMIREFHLADWFTLGNAVCGTAGLFATITYVQTGSVRHLYFAGALVLAAFVFDVFDGRVARWRQTHSAMGRELDSLADVMRGASAVSGAVLGSAEGALAVVRSGVPTVVPLAGQRPEVLLLRLAQASQRASP